MRVGAKRKIGHRTYRQGRDKIQMAFAREVTGSGGIRGSLLPSAHMSGNVAIQRDRAHFFEAKDAAEDSNIDTIWR